MEKETNFWKTFGIMSIFIFLVALMINSCIVQVNIDTTVQIENNIKYCNSENITYENVSKNQYNCCYWGTVKSDTRGWKTAYICDPYELNNTQVIK